MSRRGRRIRLALLPILVALAAPGSASAAQSLAVTSPTGFPAGGDPSYTTSTTLDDSAGTPSKVTIALQPGVLASANANPSCVTGAPQYTAACHIGSGSASTAVSLVAIPLEAYFVAPPTSDDVAGIDLVPSTGPVTHAGAKLVQTPDGNVQTVLHLELDSSTAGLIRSMSLTVNGTLNGKPFTRMPTRCTPTESSMLTVVYANKTETTAASPDFKPTGCASLPFAPKLSAVAVKDSKGPGASATTTVTQAPDEAASASTSLLLPAPMLSPNFYAVAIQNTNVSVGTATSASPLLPKPLTGKAYLTGALNRPTLTLRFPPPAKLELTGTISLTTGAVTFTGIPDVPTTKLTVALFGGKHGLLRGDCSAPPGVARGTFTGQNGKAAVSTVRLTLSGCPGAPRVSGARISGLAAGHPSIHFKATHGKNAPKLKSLRISVPRGLSFVTGRRLASGVVVSAAHRLTVDGGALVITLRRPVATMTVGVSSKALAEGRSLRSHPPAHPRLSISITDASGGSTNVTVRT
jgi:hypothetical protein